MNNELLKSILLRFKISEQDVNELAWFLRDVHHDRRSKTFNRALAYAVKGYILGNTEDYITSSTYVKPNPPSAEEVDFVLTIFGQVKRYKFVWSTIANYVSVTNKFVEKYKKYLDGFELNFKRKTDSKILLPQKVTFRLIEKVVQKYESKLTEEFWNAVSIFPKVSEEFLRKYSNKLNWLGVSAFQRLPGTFMEEYRDKLDWEYVSLLQDLSFDTLVKCKSYIETEKLLYYNKWYRNRYNTFSEDQKELLDKIYGQKMAPRKLD